MGKYYEDLAIGEKYTSSGRTITETDVVHFAGLSGDYNPLHTDKIFAEQSQFGRRIAHGALTFSIMTGLWDQLGIIRETVVAFYGVDAMRFLNPVLIGTTIHAEIEILEKRDRGENGIVVMRNSVLNEKGELVMICDALLLMKKNPS
ncbi:MAG: MaoC family dehydratase N-terminal domain-containing protein [Theionarchaea archaeon]|nr:MaoC family dehydratase N-terminal domain-containing protein [Theionarchaea archaeon]MBU7000717.1 MaoC family dehydratase N-terminal domain-containing protein [Theionarchaea archaeon]MBU7021500.1 MaoC family dehydratase N-terminal domain-containing protein [Theionarchaea archaeon]MBU7033561.1 MaoC family dehydratase N-terminal domain-containing protein [Theionarchaea archaeon]MBU7039631.1 MaoC family dehydratase N-terminal domain-containing protein [Theionarchaea archaeon]